MRRKPLIYIIAKDKEEAVSFYKNVMGDKNIECDTSKYSQIHEHPMYTVCFMKEYYDGGGCGRRCDFVYAKKRSSK